MSIRASLPAELLANLDRVIVFKSATANGVGALRLHHAGRLHAQPGRSPGQCNSYAGSTVQGTIASTSGALDNFWDPTVRNDDLADPAGLHRRVGAHHARQQDRRPSSTTCTITRVSIYRIQPDIDG